MGEIVTFTDERCFYCKIIYEIITSMHSSLSAGGNHELVDRFAFLDLSGDCFRYDLAKFPLRSELNLSSALPKHLLASK